MDGFSHPAFYTLSGCFGLPEGKLVIRWLLGIWCFNLFIIIFRSAYIAELERVCRCVSCWFETWLINCRVLDVCVSLKSSIWVQSDSLSIAKLIILSEMEFYERINFK